MVKYRHRQFLIEPCAKCFENFEITLHLTKTVAIYTKFVPVDTKSVTIVSKFEIKHTKSMG